MIVRINQFNLSDAESLAGWDSSGLRGPIDYAWPEDTYALEVLILEQDEHNQPLARGFRQEQVRQLIPQVLSAMKEPEERIIVRLDGPLERDELLGSFEYLTDSAGEGRFAISSAEKLQHESVITLGSIRLQLSTQRLTSLCADPNVGLDRQVRLRAFAVPSELVNPLLDTSDLSDERWREILPQAGFVLSTMRPLESLYLLTRHLTPADARNRLMEKLLGKVPSGRSL